MSSEKQSTVLDNRLVEALSHEVRMYAMLVFSERPASTKEVAAELGMSVSAVWYHVNKLVELGCIEEVATKRRRGAVERFFIAKEKCYFDESQWRQLPPHQQQDLTMKIVRLIAGDLDHAIRVGTVNGENNHVSHTPMFLDSDGWSEAIGLLERTLVELLEIRSRAGKRLAGNVDAGVRTSVSLMQFELPNGRGPTGHQRATD